MWGQPPQLSFRAERGRMPARSRGTLRHLGRGKNHVGTAAPGCPAEQSSAAHAETKNNCHSERSASAARRKSKNPYPSPAVIPSECPRAVEGPCAPNCHSERSASECESQVEESLPFPGCHPERSASECPRAVEGPCVRHPLVIPSGARANARAQSRDLAFDIQLS